MNFKPGDRVVCIDDDFGKYLKSNLKKGLEYIVHDTESCCSQFVNVGAIVSAKEVVIFVCRKCNKEQPPRQTIEFVSSRRFRKVQEQTRVVRIQMEQKEPALN